MTATANVSGCVDTPWGLHRPQEHEDVIWSQVDRAVRSVAHMAELISWGRQHTRTLVFGMPEAAHPLVVTPQANGNTIRRCMDLAHDSEQEARTISHRFSSSHEALRAAGRHGRDFERFRWTSGTLSKVLRSPSLMGHRTHRGQTVRDACGTPVLIGQPLLSDEEFQALQDALLARSNGTRRPRSRMTALLTGVAHCAGCAGRMYFAERKGYPYGDYVCRATARGEVCPAPATMRSDWLEAYTVDRYREATATDAAVSRELLLESGVRVTVTKVRCGGGPARLGGPDTSRLTFTLGEHFGGQHHS